MTDDQDHGEGVAVVLGGSVAGMLAARALTDRYQRVVVVDRDSLDPAVGPTPRRGVPQGRHAHGLLAAGRQAIEELLPGATDDLVAAGVPTGDVLGDLRFFTQGHQLGQTDIGLLGVASSRPYLESYVRHRVTALPEVRLRDTTDIVGLETTPDRTRVTGVHVQSREEGSEAELIRAELVVDATGRASRTPHWLDELGYQRPEEERIGVDLAYVTREYRREPDQLGGDLAIIVGPTQDNHRGAFVQAIEGDRVIVTLFGILGDHPPTDSEEFLGFAKSVPRPDVYEAIDDAEPLTEPVLFRFPHSSRRRYERLRRFPEGLAVIGDAVCTFNPLYGQGMSVAAIEATVLRRQVAEGLDWRRYFTALKPVVDTPWQIATGADLTFPGVRGKRTLAGNLVSRYIARMQAAATHDLVLSEAFTRVSNLLEPPSLLMRPPLALRALRGGGKKGRRSPTRS
ncbi:FAD-dependent monooxygenase [Streptomyces sp. NPDC005438]|uniref:FAD-dependent oxidoreductase n=1 Tax=Streptomyces sp. NPDC005438 TaxID=3156880 RepID=UPI0033BABAD1